MRAKQYGTAAARRGAIAFVVFAAISAATLRAQDDPARIPQLQPPPPLDPRFLQRFQGTVRTTIEDVSFRTSLGQMVSFDRLEMVMDPEAMGTDVVHARLIRIVRPSFISPVDTVSTPFDPFMDIPGPRTRVDRLIIEDGTFGTHAHPSQYEGRWLWYARGVNVDVRDITLGGGGMLAARVASANASAELRGSPILLRNGTVAVRRVAGILDLDVAVDLADSDIAVTGTLRRTGEFRADVRTVPLAFADARTFLPELPAEGTAEIDATIEGGTAPLAVALRRFVARARSSALDATGEVQTGADGFVRDLVVDVPAIVAADLDSLFGLSLPGDGTWRGSVRANGPLATGVAIRGSLERAEGGPPNGSFATRAALPRIAFEGTFNAEPRASMALQLDADRIPVRGGVATAAVRVHGPVDSLSIGGTVRGTGARSADEIFAQLDAVVVERPGTAHRLLRAAADVTASLAASGGAPARPAHDVTARAEGTAVLAANGEIDARVVSDPVPLAVLPLPSALDSITGDVRADVAIAGTLEEPLLRGTLDVRDGGFRVPAARLDVRGLAGPIVLHDGVAELDALAGRANGGTIDIGGSVRLLGGERTADVTLVARDVALIANDSVRVLAAADLSARGALLEPLVGADARLVLERPVGGVPLATLTGTLDLARDNALDFVLRADSLPLDALPAPSAVRDLRGGIAGSLRIGGTMGAPTTEGRFDLRAAGVTVVRTGTTLSGMRGALVVRDGVVTLDGMRGTIGGGALALEGEARVASGERTVDARLTIDRGRIAETDSMLVVASADITATGSLARPNVGGGLTIHDGWVHEDNFARNPPIDTASPPYDELIERVPWIANSRLRTRVARPLETDEPPEPQRQVVVPAPPRDVTRSIERADGPPLTGRVRVDIEPGLLLVDEDSEIHGVGTVFLVADSAGMRTEGLYRMYGGYYAQYGSVFDIKGGAFLFAGGGLLPAVTMRSEHRFEAPLGSWITPGPRIMDRFPPLDFFALGTQESAGEEVRRLSLLPESRTELGALLLYSEEPQPVTGLRNLGFWAPDDGGALFGESSATRGIVLLANYIANESYDYLPLERAYMRAGIIDVGPSRPGRITVGPYIQGGLYLGGLHAIVTQAVEGGTAPGIRLRYRLGTPELLAFSEPRFLSTAPLPGGTVFTHGRRTGVGLRWLWEW